MSIKQTSNVIKIGGKEMPPIMSLTITREKIWSRSTGRTGTGEIVGDIVARKMKLVIGFAPMSDDQAKLLDDAIDQAFFTVEFRSPHTGTRQTITAYAGTPSYPLYSYVDGLPRYVGVGVDLIEK